MNVKAGLRTIKRKRFINGYWENNCDWQDYMRFSGLFVCINVFLNENRKLTKVSVIYIIKKAEI